MERKLRRLLAILYLLTICRVAYGQSLFTITNDVRHGGGGGANYAFVNAAFLQGAGSCSTSPCSLSISPANGHVVLVDWQVYDAGSSLTYGGYDNGSSVWHTAYINNNSYVSSFAFGEFYTCSSAGSPSLVGITFTGSANATLTVREYSYAGGGCSLDQVSTLNSASSNSISTNNITTVTANELLSAGFFQLPTCASVPTSTTPFTDRADSYGGIDGLACVSGLDEIVTSSGTYSASGTVTGTPPWGAYIVSYK